MSDDTSQETKWLGVIARSLAYLSLGKAQQDHPTKFGSILEKVKFLQELGLQEADAALLVGSTPKSVQVMRSQLKGSSRGKTKKR